MRQAVFFFRFCLDRLKTLCQEILVKDLSPNNVCERLRAADMYNAPILKWKILNLLQKHLNYIIDNEVSRILLLFFEEGIGNSTDQIMRL